MIYTSYYDNLKNINTDIFAPIGISGWIPDNYIGARYIPLSPKWAIYKEYQKTHDAVQYTKRYKEEVLAKRNINKVIRDLYILSDNKIPILLCYETPEKFCHRKIVADWFTDNGFYTLEFGNSIIFRRKEVE